MFKGVWVGCAVGGPSGLDDAAAGLEVGQGVGLKGKQEWAKEGEFAGR